VTPEDSELNYLCQVFRRIESNNLTYKEWVFFLSTSYPFLSLFSLLQATALQVTITYVFRGVIELLALNFSLFGNEYSGQGFFIAAEDEGE
jgi:hypothetical protein